MSSPAVPKTMRALELRGHEPTLALVEKPVPTPARGEVLLRVGAAPINPNDLMFLKGRYEVTKPLPVVPGFEGSGTVVGTGGGFIARTMLGRRVACAAGQGDGTWAEYLTVPAMRCVPLRRGIDLDTGATMLTNPLTAWALVSRAKRDGHRGVVLTAAAGALGRMLCRLAARERLAVVAVVRKKEQVDALRELGVSHVLDSTSPDFDAELSSASTKADATLALDAVAGELTGRIMAAMPDRSVVKVYGMLSNEPCRIDSKEIVFRGKRLEGFTMYEWLRTTGLFAQILTAMKVQDRLGDALATHVRARVAFADHADGLRLAREGATGGKILLVP